VMLAAHMDAIGLMVSELVDGTALGSTEGVGVTLSGAR